MAAATSATARASASRSRPELKPGDAHQPRIVDHLEARGGGRDEARALPFLEAAADRLAADAELLGDLRLAELSRETDPVGGGDAEIGGIFDEPVGEHDVGVLVALAVLRPDRVDEAAGGKSQEARADRRVDVEERREVGPGQRDDARGRQRPRHGRARRLARIEAGSDQLHLAENVAFHDAGEAQRRAGAVLGEADLHERLGAALGAGPRVGEQIDAVGRLAGLEDRLAGSKRAAARPERGEPPPHFRVGGLEEPRFLENFVVGHRPRPGEECAGERRACRWDLG